MSDAMNFDLAPVVIPVTIYGTAYELREATLDGATKYRNGMIACGTYGPDGKPTSIDPAKMMEADLILLAACLYHNGACVSEDTIRALPNRVVQPLIAKAKEISALGDVKEADVKN